MKLFIIVSLAALVATNAFADSFSAVAYDFRTGAVGMSEKQPNAGAAQQAAVLSCGRMCKLGTWAQNGYVAISSGRKETTSGLSWIFNWTVDPDKDKAADLALRACRLQTSNSCELRAVGGGS